ncbi:hypothetical protein QM467_13915 [Rhodoblastus sp. 17X3]|uniref:hypothetical protein n=1 Tax=Rhodoblastus sp. 17X3 TaxID=3047026 RepID=UPI0024B7BF1E|nr:hypothetical protein [Rhodoblastus sp. 17X3]MDI9849153.1 hypothetical protein [Rhodoblastus sp. 17X3]
MRVEKLDGQIHYQARTRPRAIISRHVAASTVCKTKPNGVEACHCRGEAMDILLAQIRSSRRTTIAESVRVQLDKDGGAPGAAPSAV